MSFFPDRTSAVALHRQLATHLRDAILAGELAGGTRLHASRTLAQQLGVSRNTVTQALDQLVAEGYLETRVGAGTYVASGLTPRARSVDIAAAARRGCRCARGGSSRRTIPTAAASRCCSAPACPTSRCFPPRCGGGSRTAGSTRTRRAATAIRAAIARCAKRSRRSCDRRAA